MLTKERQDPRVTRTRQLILKAFQELLVEKSFESLTVQEIADRATVNRATFYAHFDDKYVLLDYAFAESFKQALYGKLPPGSEFSPMNMQLLIQTVCEFLVQLHAHCAPSAKAQFDALVERQFKIHLKEFLLGWLRNVESNQSNARDNVELRATITSWAIYGIAVSWVGAQHVAPDGERKESLEEFAQQALPMILAGLQVQEKAVPYARREMASMRST